MARPEIYVSLDIETLGPCPSRNAVVSIGAAAFLPPAREPVATFSVNLEEWPGAEQSVATLAWWAGQPAAWEVAMQDRVAPAEGYALLRTWLLSLPGKPVALVYPSWDAVFLHDNLTRFLGLDPFGRAYLDLKSYLFATGLVSEKFRETAKSRMPAWLFTGSPAHTHVALDDAIGQGIIFVNAWRKLHGVEE